MLLVLFFAFFPGLSPFWGIIFYTSFIITNIFRSSLSWEHTYPCLKTAEIKALLCNWVWYHARLCDRLNSSPRAPPLIPGSIGSFPWSHDAFTVLQVWTIPSSLTLHLCILSLKTLHTPFFFSEVEIKCKCSKL